MDDATEIETESEKQSENSTTNDEDSSHKDNGGGELAAGPPTEESIQTNDSTTTTNDEEENDTETESIQFKNYCKQLLLLTNFQQHEQQEHKHEKNDEHSTYKTIPMFYHKLPKNSDSMAQKLREEARTLFLQKRSKELLDNNELKVLWGLLEKNYTMPPINAEQFISYDDYLKVVRLAGEKCK